MNVQCACLVDWYIFCLSPKITWIGVVGEVGKFNDSTKSILIEDVVLPESKRAFHVMCYLVVLLWNRPYIRKRLRLECAGAALPSTSRLDVSMFHGE